MKFGRYVGVINRRIFSKRSSLNKSDDFHAIIDIDIAEIIN